MKVWLRLRHALSGEDPETSASALGARRLLSIPQVDQTIDSNRTLSQSSRPRCFNTARSRGNSHKGARGESRLTWSTITHSWLLTAWALQIDTFARYNSCCKCIMGTPGCDPHCICCVAALLDGIEQGGRSFRVSHKPALRSNSYIITYFAPGGRWASVCEASLVTFSVFLSPS